MDVEAAAIAALARVHRFRVRTLVTFYVVIALITFGHSASTPRYICVSGKLYNAQDVGAPDLRPAVEGLFAAVLWPLYWSWEVADTVRGPKGELTCPTST